MEGSHERESEDALLVAETAEGGGKTHCMYKNKEIICQHGVHFMSLLSAVDIVFSGQPWRVCCQHNPPPSRLIVTLQSDSGSNARRVHRQRAFLSSLCARVPDSSIQSHFSREISRGYAAPTPFLFFFFFYFRDLES